MVKGGARRCCGTAKVTISRQNVVIPTIMDPILLILNKKRPVFNIAENKNAVFDGFFVLNKLPNYGPERVPIACNVSRGRGRFSEESVKSTFEALGVLLVDPYNLTSLF